MNVAYWLVAGLLAAFYTYAGGLKLTRSQDQLAPMMAWAGTTMPMQGVRVIGALEVLGVAGLVLPRLLDTIPGTAALSALGLLVLQVLALGFHLSRRETKDLWLNVLLLVAAAVATWLAITQFA